MKYCKRIVYLALIIISLAAISCGGSGSSNSGGGGSQNTVINGTITNIIASTENKNKAIKFADIIEYISFVREARAQGGVLVTAIVDGTTVASDIADAQGDFSLAFNINSATNVLIVFDINGDIVSVELVVEEGSIVNLIITINLNSSPGDEVEIVEMESIVEAIRCETGSVFIEKNPNETLIIDGNGEDCIRTAGNCSLFIDPQDIILTDCEKCIDTRGTSDVTIISTDGDITCDAKGDGIRAVGNSQVSIDAFGEIDISSGENGIKADGNSFISIGASICTIDSAESQIEINGNATVDTSGCGEIF